ncbi:hypothetical protein C8R45DRAFT_933252 [Mycena sanguinolenta]|nr:hypothetical protein C8R45DRAFT_933252 [Mycena sanguinolenta]
MQELCCVISSPSLSFSALRDCDWMAHTSTPSSDSLLDDMNAKSKAAEKANPIPSVNDLRRTYILAIGLHVGLVLLHLALTNHCSPRNSVEYAVGGENTLSVVIIVVSQVFAVFQVYLAAAVYLMQQLSLWRNLDIRQTLTAFHDKHAAWSGPGSALSTLRVFHKSLRIRGVNPSYHHAFLGFIGHLQQNFRWLGDTLVFSARLFGGENIPKGSPRCNLRPSDFTSHANWVNRCPEPLLLLKSKISLKQDL